VKVGSAIIGPKGAHVQQLKEVLLGIMGWFGGGNSKIF